MRFVHFVLLLTMTFGTLPVAAEDAAVYESLSDVTVGRIFFSTAQRERLDTSRSTRGMPVSVRQSPGNTDSRVRHSDAAGYFIDASGRARIYRDGEFIAVADRPRVTFPGEVKVVRGQTPKRPSEVRNDTNE